MPLSALPLPTQRFEVRATQSLDYAVDLSHGVLDLANPLLARTCAGRRLLLCVSPSIDQLYGAAIRRYFAHHHRSAAWQYCVIATGEALKTLRTVELICEQAKHAHMDRHGLLVAFGGGILCDLVGFAASIYKRGIRYVKVNTTLVGQVDVGVGVKTGVNFQASKNLLGSYYPAFASINDPHFLHSLPLRQLSCGLAEIIKMALILSPELFELLERQVDGLLCRRFATGQRAEAAADARILALAMQLMLDELQPNLREHQLERLVDFGHSFSPVLEIDSEHRLLHGEAVAIDMALCACIAVEIGWLTNAEAARVLALLRACDLPLLDPATCQLERLESALQDMALHRAGCINVVLPRGLGRADFLRRPQELPRELLAAGLARLHGHSVAPAVAVPA